MQTNNEVQKHARIETVTEFESMEGPAVKREMVVAIVYNPISGDGSGKKMAEEARSFLEKQGHTVRLRESEAKYDAQEIAQFFDSADAIVVAGGDGTVMGLLPHIVKSGVPFYMLPGGNESLIAKEFGMKRDPSDIAARLENVASTHHFGTIECNGEKRPFFIMASLGLDSAIVADIAKNRHAPVGDIGYLMPTVRSLMNYQAPKVTLKVDGNEVISNEPGFLIVANSKQYAKNLGLVPEADTTSNELCARFVPGKGVATYLSWLPALLTGGKINLDGTKLYRGSKFEINVEGDTPYPIQADGDLAGATPALIELSAATVKVLT